MKAKESIGQDKMKNKSFIGYFGSVTLLCGGLGAALGSSEYGVPLCVIGMAFLVDNFSRDTNESKKQN